MKLPRDLGGEELARCLKGVGYQVSRQTGSHLRLTTERKGEHHVTIPKHKPLRVGTLSSILRWTSKNFSTRYSPISRSHSSGFGVAGVGPFAVGVRSVGNTLGRGVVGESSRPTIVVTFRFSSPGRNRSPFGCRG